MSVQELAALISGGFSENVSRAALTEQTQSAIDAIFKTRYTSRSKYAKRVVLISGENESASFAGLVHEQSPSSGVYGGMSLIWFPVEASDEGPAGSLLTFVVGTRGLAADEQILGRPGHARYLQALRRHLKSRYGVSGWVKSDPTNVMQPMPEIVREQFGRFKPVHDKYGSYIYAAVEVPHDEPARTATVQSFLDLYAWERQWMPRTAVKPEIDALKNDLRSHVFPRVDEDAVHTLLRERRFVVLQGPPGTGKTRLADRLKNHQFNGSGRTVQFHPAVTYETFISGIAPDVAHDNLRFNVKSGWLLDASRSAEASDYLLVIDEINRGDLGRVLGEAIYLFEAAEIGNGNTRTVKLPHPVDGKDTLSIPKGLFVIGTMNTADRSIAQLDLAVRRRFAFVDVWPDADVILNQNLELASKAFGNLQDIFTKYAPDDALTLLPGHAYFLAESDAQLRRRLQYELIPLLRDYVQEGRLGSCENELRAYIDWLDSEIQTHAANA